MCGIAGYFALTPRSLAPREVLARMVEAVRHRGPDDGGIYYDGRAALGHRRLSIIDLSGGKQPLATADGNLWVTFNGEIFNHVELRDELIARRSVPHEERHRDDPACLRARRTSGTGATSASSWRATAWACGRCTTRCAMQCWF